MPKREKSKIGVVIVVLAVLLTLSVASLAGIAIYRHFGETAAASGTAPDNVITREAKASNLGYSEAGNVRAVLMRGSGTKAVGFTVAPLSASGASENETLTLSEREPEDNTPFEAKNMFPGDSVTQYYNVKVKHKSDMTLSFHADIREGYDKLAEVLECRVVLTDTQEELYSGLMRDMPESLNTALTAQGSATSEVRYGITVSLPTSVGNEYMSKALVADFRWWVEREEEPEPTQPGYEPPVVIVSPTPTDEPTPEPTEEPSPEPTDAPPDTGDQPPKTGDDFNLALWCSVAGVSLIMLILLLIKRKKEEPADEN